MKNRSRLVNLLGFFFGIITLAIIILSLTLLIKYRPSCPLLWILNIRGAHRQSFERKKPFGRVDGEEIIAGVYERLEVRNIAGNIRITGWDNDNHHVKYRKTGPALDIINDIQVKLETSDKTLLIMRELKPKPSSHRGSVIFDISIPDTVKNIEVHSVSGIIELNKIHDGVSQDLKTVSGKILTDNAEDLTAISTSGAIDFQFSGKNLFVQTVSGNIKGTCIDISTGGTLELKSVSGSVSIRADKSFNTDLNIKSISGSVSCDFPINRAMQKRNQLEGKIGDGKIPLKINTISGSIAIQEL